MIGIKQKHTGYNTKRRLENEITFEKIGNCFGWFQVQFIRVK